MTRLLIFLTLLMGSAWAEVLTQTLHPAAHRALWDDTLPGNGLLLVTLGGTRSQPQDLESLQRVATRLGYRVLALDYPNHVISTACRESPQADAFDRFRSEIVEGKAVSDLVEVDAANSIQGRIQNSLQELAEGSDAAIWKPFVTSDGPNWSKVVVVGHSQGSGHAAYLGKIHELGGVLMLAGPQDHGAKWLGRPGKTPADRYFSFLHRDDFFNSSQQIEAASALGLDSASVIVTARKVRDPHMSVIDPIFATVWVDLLSRLARPLSRIVRQPQADGGWIEHWKDGNPHFLQRRFLSSQRWQNPAVVSAFASDAPHSGSFLLHYAGDPPQPDRPVPVLLVPGAKVDATFYSGLAQHLRKLGFRVYALTFAHNQDDNFVQAQHVANGLSRVRALTGAAQVDLVGHSKGSIVATLYCSPGFRQPWMSAYAGDVRRLLLVGGPNGGLDYFHRHPFQDQGASNWPMVWETYKGADCQPYGFGMDGYWPGQTQLVSPWDQRFPVPAQDRLSYYGGTSPEIRAAGIEAARQAGDCFIEKLRAQPLAPGVQVGLLAGNQADVPGFGNETAGPSDGIILVESALLAPKAAKVVMSEELPCNHLELVLGSLARQRIVEFLSR